jgi:tetratricopeptide (TPR) repeat protein
MRIIIVAFAAALAVAGSPSAQGVKSASPEAQRANRHYAQGWSAMRAEEWAQAAREFQDAIDADREFRLAYYSLGRAEMGRRDFARAIAAYTKCRELYTTAPGNQFSSQFDERRRIDDRILELQMALTQATNKSSGANPAQSQSLMVRELQNEITRMQQARDRNISGTIDTTGPPFFVPMALGAAYFRSGQFADAEREYKAAIAANAASGETHNNLAVLYLTTGRFAEAESEVRAAEKVGFRVNENLKGDIRRKKGGA